MTMGYYRLPCRGAGHRHARGVVGLLLALWALGPTGAALAQGTFAYRKAITVNGGAGGPAGGPHLDFPLLVSLPNDASLLARVVAGGRDISFRGQDDTTCGGAGTSPCLLPHEIEHWDGATGTLVAWVRVPSVNVGTVIYMYYGNAQVAGATQTPAAVWEPGYVGVWHLGETGSGSVNEYRDSGAFANHGRGGNGVAAAIPSRVAGQIGFAQNFSNGDGTYDFVDAGSDGTLNLSGTTATVEAWVRHNIVVNTAHGTPPTTDAPYGILAHKGWDNGYSLWLEGDDAQCPGSDTRPCAIFNLPGRSHSLRSTMTAGPGPGAWHHVVGTYDGATQSLYVDGALLTSMAKTGNIAPSGAEPGVYIGHGDLPENVAWSGQFEGDIDEVRISNVTRSANWILTEYRNQSAPASFYTAGGETAAGVSLATFRVNYRSIGTAAAYTTGTISVTNGSASVTGSGTTWRTANRGRGDVITIPCPDPPTCTGGVAQSVLATDSETQLRLASPFAGTTGAGTTYSITRAFGTPQAWESCVSGGGCPGVSSVSLVADNRSEVGILYYDGSVQSGPGPLVTFDGSTTDAGHTITLTVDPGNRHPGRSAGSKTWASLVNTGAGSLVRIWDGNVTVEWLDLSGGTGDPIEINNVPVGSPATVRYNVIHDSGSSTAGIRILNADTVANIHNNVIYATGYGIRFVTDLNPAARVNIFNNTIYGNTGATGPSGIKTTVRQTTQRIDLRNNIVHSNNTGDIGLAPFFDRVYFYNGAYSDITAQATTTTLNTTLNFANVGTDCLYLGSANPFRGVAASLATGAAISGADLQWQYWSSVGPAWVNLETTPFFDGTFNFQYNGFVYWSDDPAGWVTTSVNASAPYYYVRACLAGGSYTTGPVERLLARADVSVAGNSNLTSDESAIAHGPRAGFVTGQNGVALGSVAFVNTTGGAENLHLQAGSVAINAASALNRYFIADIDAALRVAPWDVGADEYGASTAVTLMSFDARPSDGAVDLEWLTGSEVDNLGFHLYRGLSENGPWTRLTASLIPGQGFSATGASYGWRDSGLTNGARYSYRLEDVDTKSVSTFHGPVFAVPGTTAAPPPPALRRRRRRRRRLGLRGWRRHLVHLPRVGARPAGLVDFLHV